MGGNATLNFHGGKINMNSTNVQWENVESPTPLIAKKYSCVMLHH